MLDLIHYLNECDNVKKLVIIDNSPSPILKKRIHELNVNKLQYVFVGKNLGYARGHNLSRNYLPWCDYHLIINPDIIFETSSTISELIEFMSLKSMHEAGIVQPLIRSQNGQVQYLCKRNPTLVAQISRMIKPLLYFKCFKIYNNYYEMKEVAYSNVPVQSTYLSGCFMLCRRRALDDVGWFDEDYFMYLEDADLSRKISMKYKCIHNPSVSITHLWDRGSHKRINLMLSAIKSYITYSKKWGLKII